jgi:hypothetical protein
MTVTACSKARQCCRTHPTGNGGFCRRQQGRRCMGDCNCTRCCCSSTGGQPGACGCVVRRLHGVAAMATGGTVQRSLAGTGSKHT